MLRYSTVVLAALLVVAPAQGSYAGEESVPHSTEIAVTAVSTGEVPAGAAVAAPAGEEAPDSVVRQELDPSGTATFRLAPGRWHIEIESEGYWSERRDLQVTEEEELLELRVLPGAKLAGTLSLPRGETARAEIGAEFRLVAPAQAHLGVEEGRARCGVDEKLRFECLLPAAVLDVGLRAATNKYAAGTCEAHQNRQTSNCSGDSCIEPTP